MEEKKRCWQNNKSQKNVAEITNCLLSLCASTDITPYCYSELFVIYYKGNIVTQFCNYV